MSNTITKKKNSFLSDKGVQFVIRIVSVYVVCKLLHYYLMRSNGVLHRGWLSIVEAIGSFYAGISSFILNLLGEQTTHSGISIIYTVKLKTLHVADHCIALPAMVIFAGTILLFSGNWKSKLWFIPMGLFFIFVINVIRIVSLSQVLVSSSHSVFDLYHSVIYVVVVYGLICAMIFWWMWKVTATK